MRLAAKVLVLLPMLLLACQTPDPTADPTPVFSEREAERFVYRTIVECVEALEAQYGATLPVSFDTRYLGDDVWFIEAWSPEIDHSYGTWKFSATSSVEPFDATSRRTQEILTNRSCVLPEGIESLLTPTPTPTSRPTVTPTPTPIPFSCRSKEGVTVGNISHNIMGLYGADVSARLTNTCNGPVHVIPSVIAYRRDGSILNSQKGVKTTMNPGRSVTITIHMTGNYDSSNASFDIEVEVTRTRR